MIDNQIWPDDLSKEVAVIDTNIKDLEKFYGVIFKYDFDDLDYFKYFIFKIDNRMYALMRYDNSPMPGVTLVIERNYKSDIKSEINEALKHLRLTDRKILWKLGDDDK